VIYYIDTEFNSFEGDLISIALIPENHDHPYFYGAVPCNDPHPWVAEHVMPVLHITPEPLAQLRQRLTAYLIADSDITIVADWPEDIQHFTRLLIVGPGRMIPIASMKFEYRNYPEFNSARVSAIPHNAVADARALRDYAMLHELRKDAR
jgi:hypothetical protein